MSYLSTGGIIASLPSVCLSWWKPHFIATIIMELSPGVMRAFNEIITMDYSLFFMGLLKTAFVIGSRARGAFSICFSILFSLLPLFTLSDCVFVRLAAAPFVAGIKACRESQDLIGNLGGKEGEDREEEKKGTHIGCCGVVLMCLNMGLSFSCPQSTH